MQGNNKEKTSHFWQAVKEKLRWFTPGIGIKRWILLILIGTTLLGLGFGVLALDVYRTAPDTWWLPVLSFLSLRFLDRILRAIIFGGLGLAFVLLGTWQLNRTLLRPFLRPGQPVIDAVSTFRKRERGPKIVTIGGGNGLSTLLRGLKSLTNNLTAIVTVADNGGSSGEIRRNMGILPPGDLRNCLAALSDDEELLTQVFQYRFGESAGLNGHSFGNLFITALADITGSFEEAVAESGRVLAIQGRVLPSTLHDVQLVASVQSKRAYRFKRVEGESEIPKVEGTIKRVWLEPNNPTAFPPAIQAILGADLIVVGPGSLFTSILPNLLVPEIAEAIKASRALKFFICNVATQKGETDKFNVGDHVRMIEKHLGHRLFDVIVCNNHYEGPLSEGVDWVKPEEDLDQHWAIYQTKLVDTHNPWRHEKEKLADTIMELYLEKTGPLAQRNGN
jgi:uncharacterized cofD-like protein